MKAIGLGGRTETVSLGLFLDGSPGSSSMPILSVQPRQSPKRTRHPVQQRRGSRLDRHGYLGLLLMVVDGISNISTSEFHCAMREGN